MTYKISTTARWESALQEEKAVLEATSAGRARNNAVRWNDRVCRAAKCVVRCCVCAKCMYVCVCMYVERMSLCYLIYIYVYDAACAVLPFAFAVCEKCMFVYVYIYIYIYARCVLCTCTLPQVPFFQVRYYVCAMHV